MRQAGSRSRAAIIAWKAGRSWQARSQALLLRGFVVGTATVPALRAALRSRLPAYMHPGTLQVLPGLPRLSGGKLDQMALLDCTLPG